MLSGKALMEVEKNPIRPVQRLRAAGGLQKENASARVGGTDISPAALWGYPTPPQPSYGRGKDLPPCVRISGGKVALNATKPRSLSAT